jgi:hypothetical protein
MVVLISYRSYSSKLLLSGVGIGILIKLLCGNNLWDTILLNASDHTQGKAHDDTMKDGTSKYQTLLAAKTNGGNTSSQVLGRNHLRCDGTGGISGSHQNWRQPNLSGSNHLKVTKQRVCRCIATREEASKPTQPY